MDMKTRTRSTVNVCLCMNHHLMNSDFDPDLALLNQNLISLSHKDDEVTLLKFNDFSDGLGNRNLSLSSDSGGSKNSHDTSSRKYGSNAES
jgi:hypothetical protein